ncbi:YlbF family regulator [Ectobacillus sp. JY-23]|uniref:YlbF family regulator n=1 Tax=Ectobacillus sp. JY-23 TaxID=2933872 RepID=UPI001FF18A31|nr:YlbF family regulator [Ectobacillus sp. JY-23]UOY93753.1 YlbF family regulator [Ectobacillus sp. JY-23]
MIIATLESVLILEEAEQLARMIIDSEEAAVYRAAYHDLQQDEEAQRLIREFVKKKELYEEVQRFGKYHPDYKKVMQEIRDIKREVDLHERISAFKKAETAIQKLLDEVSVCIGTEISPYIKVPTGNPFFDSAGGCSGGCGTGGSCGCRKTG